MGLSWNGATAGCGADNFLAVHAIDPALHRRLAFARHAVSRARSISTKPRRSDLMAPAARSLLIVGVTVVRRTPSKLGKRLLRQRKHVVGNAVVKRSRGGNLRCGAGYASNRGDGRTRGAEHGERAHRAFPPPNVVATVCPSGISTMKAMAPLVGRPITESFRERATSARKHLWPHG